MSQRNLFSFYSYSSDILHIFMSQDLGTSLISKTYLKLLSATTWSPQLTVFPHIETIRAEVCRKHFVEFVSKILDVFCL